MSKKKATATNGELLSAAKKGELNKFVGMSLEKLTNAVYTAAYDAIEAGVAYEDVRHAIDEALDNWGEVDAVRRKKEDRINEQWERHQIKAVQEQEHVTDQNAKAIVETARALSEKQLRDRERTRPNVAPERVAARESLRKKMIREQLAAKAAELYPNHGPFKVTEN
jgi:hypothetical protein